MRISDWTSDVCSSDLLRVHPLQLADQVPEAVRRHLGDPADAILVAQQVRDLLVEHLPGELVRLVQDHPSVLGIGVVAEVGALVDETAAVRVDHDAERVGVLLERSEARRVGNGCVSTGSSRWWTYHYKKKKSRDDR